VSKSEWRLVVSPTARRDLGRLPDKALFAVLETIEAIGENPHRLGKRLHFELKDHLSARRGPYRVLYRVNEASKEISIAAVGHRSDVYRQR
jgi:mRNA-degrading endonuclease RelE of RelBE toxin-antitoxin system